MSKVFSEQNIQRWLWTFHKVKNDNMKIKSFQLSKMHQVDMLNFNAFNDIKIKHKEFEI